MVHEAATYDLHPSCKMWGSLGERNMRGCGIEQGTLHNRQKETMGRSTRLATAPKENPRKLVLNQFGGSSNSAARPELWWLIKYGILLQQQQLWVQGLVTLFLAVEWNDEDIERDILKTRISYSAHYLNFTHKLLSNFIHKFILHSHK